MKQWLPHFAFQLKNSGHNIDWIQHVRVDRLPRNQTGQYDTGSFVMLSPLVAYGLAYYCFSVIVFIVNEKENRLRESIRRIGLADSVYWLSYFLFDIVWALGISVVFTSIIGALFFRAEYIVFLFVLILEYCLSIACLGYFFASFFEEGKVSTSTLE